MPEPQLERESGFYWIRIEDETGWEVGHWHMGCWVTFDGPLAIVLVTAVGDRIVAPERMPFTEVRER